MAAKHFLIPADSADNRRIFISFSENQRNQWEIYTFCDFFVFEVSSKSQFKI